MSSVYTMKYDKLIFAQLVEENFIPEKGTFVITDRIMERYIEVYSEFKGTGNLRTNSNKTYAKKLAGISFLKLNEQRAKSSTEYSKTKSGIVYLISNPAFPGFYKIGITSNLIKRLSSYQTYDPLRRYRVEHYKIVPNAREYEKYLLNHNNVDLAKGEWVKGDIIKRIFISD